MLFRPEIPFLSSFFDLITVTFIFALIILSVLSLCFIFHLRLKSKYITHLQGFNSLWTVRFLLVVFIIFWAITELLRLPLFCRIYVYPLLPSVIPEQSNICKIHILLSLGFFEPTFLTTLLYLLNASIKKKTRTDARAITSVLITSLPIATLQALLIYFEPFEKHVSPLLRQTSVVLNDGETVLCTYPFLNSVAFAGFGATYSTWFVFSCWRLLSLVINKSLRRRVNGLACVVLVALPLQVVSLGLSMFWSPNEKLYGVVSFMVFLCTLCCAVTGEGILVIKPISDALEAGANSCLCSPLNNESRKLEHVVIG